MNAYDYTTQQWVTGDAARRLLISQAQQTLALVTGPRRSEYAHATGKDPDAVAQSMRQQLQELGA